MFTFPFALFSGGVPPGYTTTANDYDGTNDFALRGADLTGNADAKTGTFSAWLRLDGGDGANQVLIENTSRGFEVLRASANTLEIRGENAIGSLIMRMVSASTYLASASHIHLCGTWDLAVPVTHFFIDDVDDEAAGSTEIDDTIDYTKADWGIGAWVTGGLKLNGCLQELWFDNVFFDVSVLANRRKLITATLKPVDLGANGELVTGTTPLIYAPDGDPSNNKGTGGNFTITGALTTCSTSASD